MFQANINPIELATLIYNQAVECRRTTNDALRLAKWEATEDTFREMCKMLLITSAGIEGMLNRAKAMSGLWQYLP